MSLYGEEYYLNKYVKYTPKYSLIKNTISFFSSFLMPFTSENLDTYLFSFSSQNS